LPKPGVPNSAFRNFVCIIHLYEIRLCLIRLFEIEFFQSTVTKPGLPNSALGASVSPIPVSENPISRNRMWQIPLRIPLIETRFAHMGNAKPGFPMLFFYTACANLPLLFSVC